MSLFRRLFSSKLLSRNNVPKQKNVTSLCLLVTQKNSAITENLKYILIVASGYLTYKYLQNKPVYPFSVLAASESKSKNLNFVADVVEKSAAAVVYIEIKDVRRFDFFTGRPQTISNGSGFIIKEDGLILTNAHVVTNKPHAKVEVRLFDGSTHQGTVENVDMQSDLATVRISARKLPVLKLGNSNTLRPGEFVVAIGSPLALSNTVTFGVISSTHRGSDELGLTGKDMVYLQTDAAITFGNSGGPLVNLDGEAIGVNSMKVTAGISFAIPSDYVKEFLKNAEVARKTGKVDKPGKRYMGITMLTLTPEILYELRQRNQYVPPEVRSGVLVWKVILASPAHNGGLLPGDIVVEMDGKPISSANDVYKILSESSANVFSLTVIRMGQRLQLYVKPENID